MAEVGDWLVGLGLGQYAAVFEENDIELDVLSDLTDQDLAELGVSMGHRKRLLRAIADLATARARAAPAAVPAPGAPERRQVTVLFCDLVGSTELSTRLDPEDLHDLMRVYQERCASIIGRFEGYIGNYIGDGILAYFGYPRAHEDDPQRAVRAGLELVEAIRALGSELAQPEVGLAGRVGIQTGLVVAGDIGSGEWRDERALVGETPNLAARLLALAEPGAVVIGPGTQHLVEGLFVLEDLGRQTLRGIPQPVAVWRVRQASDVPSRFEASVVRGLTPLVGRDEELQLLLSRWEQAKEGEGQVVFLAGEAGIGKSRIAQTLRQAVEDEPHVGLRYFCSPFYSQSALHPFLDQLERAAALYRHDPPDVKLDQLEALLAQATPHAAEAAAVLAPLMSIPSQGRYPPLELTPQQHKARAFAVFTEQLAGLAAHLPVLMTLEDVHWIDPSSIDLIHRLIDRAQRLPIMMVLTFRPDYEPPWAGVPNLTTLSLTRLTQRQAATLVDRVTGGKSLPVEVLERIVARTDGVPLFVEELTKAVLETGLLEDAGDRYVLKTPLPALAIPASLRDSLMARLDRLAPIKEIAQVAATLGRNFSQELLEAVSSVKNPELGDALSQLIEAELLYRHGSPPTATYDFKHALVQDVAYGSLLRSKRQQLHMRIGMALEERFAETAETKPELLSHHFREAGLPVRAIPYAIRAGDLSAARYASAEARVRYGDALAMARELPPTDDAVEAQIQAVLKLASVALNRAHFEADLEDLAIVEPLAERLQDRPALCQIRYWTGRLNYVLGRFDLGVNYATQALQMADALGAGDDITAPPVNLLARLHCLRGEPRAAILQARRNVAQMRAIGNKIEEAAVSGVLAFAYGLHGEFDHAFAAAESGVKLAERIDHLPTLAACLHFRGVVRGWHGDLDQAVPSFEEAIAVADRAGDVFRKYLAYGWRGEAYIQAGHAVEGEADLLRCLELGGQIGTSFHRGAFQAFLAKIRLAEGAVDEAMRLADEAVQLALETAQAWSGSIAQRVRAEALLAGDPPALDAAEQAVREAIRVQEERECRCDLAWSTLVLGRVLAGRGDPAGAAQAHATSQALLAEMGMTQLAGAAILLEGSPRRA